MKLHGICAPLLKTMAILALTTTSCATTAPKRDVFVFTPKPQIAPVKLYCFDTIGHTPGSKPFLLGGTCLCTPTQKLLEDYQAHGYFVGMSLDGLLQEYKQRGVQTALDHQQCNNSCPWGPHFVQGGHCLVPPTPGTRHYEEILTGNWPRPVQKPSAAKKQR